MGHFFIERNKTMIEITNLSKQYHLKNNLVTALDNVTLKIEDGKIYGIIGYSGAGKSTLVRCINLLEKPDSGSIIIDSEVLTKEENGKQVYLKGAKLNNLRRNVGMIFQHFNLLDRSTVRENIAYTLRYSHIKKADINKRVRKSNSGFTSPINHDDEPVQTITAGGYCFRMCDGLLMTDKDIINCQTFPQDYDFKKQSVQYVCGMSVPPVMMAKISEQVYRQWLKGDKNDEKTKEI